MATITISRQFGAGGATLGKRLAKRLGYRLVDDELIKEVAEKTGVSAEDVAALESGRGSTLTELLCWVMSPDFVEKQASDQGFITEKRYVEEVKSLIIGLHEKGNVIIIGRGGNFTLRGYPNTVHVLLVADMEHRVRFLADKYKMTRSEAEKAIKRADFIRHRFLNCFSEQQFHDDPHLYTIALNMNFVSMDKAEDIIASLIF